MFKLSLFSFLLFTLSFANPLFNPTYVDTQKFSGLWYEIARTYNNYEKECVAASVEYTLDKDAYDVHNRCFKESIGAKLIEYKGTAKAINGKDMSALKMTYFWIFSKKYRVVYLNAYKTAVLSDEDFKNLWIMSRTPKMDKAELAMILENLKSKMDTQKLIFTTQEEQGRYR